ncbi:MAG: septal ring lytic transglycosylase RlpA family protein [Candidatus Moranbacteria bacterium]|nr:septal ring lytic transglycosylase RlpA family protein [Candidatus Moranbacteria bacterium]
MLASWYGPGFHGKKTFCRTVFNQYGLTAASNTLPCGTKVRLFNARGKSVDVTITDTGSFTWKYGRDIDVSYKVAKVLDLVEPGKGHLELKIVSLPSKKSGA